MGELKKVISLNQASSISGYHQDYLSALMRKNEIKGEKVGHNWFTTEKEIKSYIFKQKIRGKNFIVRYLFSFIRENKSFLYSFIFLALLSGGIYFYNQAYSEINDIKTQIKNEESSRVDKLEVKEELTF